MNEFRQTCPHCRQRLRCDGRLAGRAVKCPRCGRAIVLSPPPPEVAPAADAADPPAAPEPTP